MNKQAQRPTIRHRFRRRSQAAEKTPKSFVNDKAPAAPGRLSSVARRMNPVPPMLRTGRKLGSKALAPVRLRRKRKSAERASSLTRPSWRQRIGANYRQARYAYDNPKDLRRRLTFSYAMVTLGVVIVVYFLFILALSGDPEEFAEIAFFSFIPAMIIFAILTMGFGSLFGYIASRNLVDRLRTLDNAASAWASGDFSVQVVDKSTDEIGQLSRKLSSMASELDQLIHERIDLAAIEERTHLARELHDSVKQQLFASSMQLSSARAIVPHNPEQADTILAAVELLVEKMQAELMALIHMLRPSSLQDQGLAVALEEYVHTWAQQMGVSAEITTSYPYPLPITTEQALFRVCQESLNNVAKHAKASAVVVKLTQQKQQTILQIKDNGRGFDPARRTIGLGMKGMHERLEKLNGMLEVESEPNWGTSVTALVFAGEITI